MHYLFSAVIVLSKSVWSVTIDATEVNLESRIVQLELELAETKETLSKVLETVSKISSKDNDKENEAVTNDDKHFYDKIAEVLITVENKFETFKEDITFQVEKKVTYLLNNIIVAFMTMTLSR